MQKSNKQSSNRISGQVLAEYAVILSIVAMVSIALSLYIQRGLQGRYKDASDEVYRSVSARIRYRATQELGMSESEAKQLLPRHRQYEPYYQSSDIVTRTDSVISDSYFPGGVARKDILRDSASSTGWRDEASFSDGAR